MFSTNLTTYPSHFFEGWLGVVWQAVLTDQYGFSSNQACLNSIDEQLNLASFVASHIIKATDELKLDDLAKTIVRRMVMKSKTDARLCLGNGQIDWRKAVAHFYSNPVQQVEKSLGIAILDVRLLDRDLPTLENLFAVGKSHRQILNHLRADYDMSRLRIFTYEEEADDFSVTFLKASGMDSESSMRFIESLMELPDLLRCREILATHEVPGYGVLSMPHHSNCYRIYHLQQILRSAS